MTFFEMIGAMGMLLAAALWALSGVQSIAASVRARRETARIRARERAKPDGWWRADGGHIAHDGQQVTWWGNLGSAEPWHLETRGLDGPTYDASHASFNGQAALVFDGGDKPPSEPEGDR